jgi:large subunit ribosomal protein L25
MDEIELNAKRRTVKKKKAKILRQEGQVPGVVYGHGIENVPLQMEALELKRILAEAGASQLIQLRIDDASSTQPVLAREIQRDIFNGDPVHVDFYAVSMTERITADVTIVLIGEPESTISADGVLLQGANTIEIECLPGDLIPSLEVDVSDLEINSSLLVSDLQVPDTITILTDPQEMVAQVVPEALLMVEEEPEEEELLEELLMEEPGEVEVIGRGRAEEEEEEEDLE